MGNNLKSIEVIYADKEKKKVMTVMYDNESDSLNNLHNLMGELEYSEASIATVFAHINTMKSDYIGVFYDGNKLIVSEDRTKVISAAKRKLKALIMIDKIGIIGNIECYNATFKYNSNGMRIISCTQRGQGAKRCNVLYGREIVILLYDGVVTDIFNEKYTIHNK